MSRHENCENWHILGKIEKPVVRRVAAVKAVHRRFQQFTCNKEWYMRVVNMVFLSINTTFVCGNLYLTPLAYKNFLFENEPTVPLAFLIHEKWIRNSRRVFWLFWVKGYKFVKGRNKHCYWPWNISNKYYQNCFQMLSVSRLEPYQKRC